MQTFEEIAEEYAKEKGLISMEQLFSDQYGCGIDDAKEIALRMSQQAIEAQREACAQQMSPMTINRFNIRKTPLITLK